MKNKSQFNHTESLRSNYPPAQGELSNKSNVWIYATLYFHFNAIL